MKKVDIIKLKLKGVSNEEIKELMELEALAEDAEQEEDKESDPAPASDPEPEQEDEQDEDDSIEKMKAEITQLKDDLIKAQKANLNKDISGSEDQTQDQDVVDDLVRSFM